MKLLVLLVLVGLVVAYPTDNSASNVVSDLVKRLDNIRGRVKEMRNIALGNYTTTGDDEEIKTANNTSEKIPTYSELADRVEQASKKVKEIQEILKRTSKHLDTNFPLPKKEDPKNEIETFE